MRKDIVLEYVLECSRSRSDFSGVTATETAGALGIWRNDAAVELNKLVAEGRLARSGRKNIRFFPAPETTASAAVSSETSEEAGGSPEDGIARCAAFRDLIGADGSLKYQLRVAMAAVSYPPNGLNMLITGPTGSGKSHLARVIWEYAKEAGTFRLPKDRIPFVVFNCAEYADNPQLLLSHLFGYKKGAFTGAFEDKPGLVEKADGGILFLDEIHCLSASGQETFFTLLDSGIYRRIGDNTPRESHFMLIGATTRPLTDLLETFLRRMPVVISMPTLSERPNKERLELISYFYSQEAAHIGRPLRVEKNALNSILDYSLHANLGALKNMIQISCAKAFLRHSMAGRRTDEIEVGFADLSFRTYNGGAEEDGFSGAERHFDRDLVASPGGMPAGARQPSSFMDVYDFVEKKISDSALGGHQTGDIQQVIASEIDHYYLDLEKALGDDQSDSQMLDSVLFPKAIGICSEFLDRASHALGRVYPPSAATLLALHISQYVSRMRSEMPAFPVDVRGGMKDYDEELAFLEANRSWLSDTLKVRVSSDEINCLAIFLRQSDEGRHQPSVWLTLVSGNDSVAAGMAAHLNGVYRSSHIHWVDSSSSGSLFRAVCDNIRLFHGTAGNIIFTDVKGLPTLEAEVEKESGVTCRVVPILENRLLMEAGRLTQNAEAAALDVMRDRILENYRKSMVRFFDTAGISPAETAEDTGEKVILSLCVTGCGSARSIKTMLEQKLSHIPNLRIAARSSLDTPAQLMAEGDILLIVGTVNPHLPDVPFFTADRVFSREGLMAIASVVDDWSLDTGKNAGEDDELSKLETMSLLAESLQYIAPHVDSEQTIACIESFIEAIETRHYGREMPADVRVRCFMHAAAMLERMANGETLVMDPEHEKLLQERASWFVYLEDLIRRAFAPFGMEIPRAENFYFMLSIPESL